MIPKVGTFERIGVQGGDVLKTLPLRCLRREQKRGANLPWVHAIEKVAVVNQRPWAHAKPSQQNAEHQVKAEYLHLRKRFAAKPRHLHIYEEAVIGRSDGQRPFIFGKEF